MDEYEPVEGDDKPEMHVADGFHHFGHISFEDCWCEPTLEYNTEYVRVYRHRSLQ